MTIGAILETAEDIERFGVWATYAMLRGYGKSRAAALWLLWVAKRTASHRIKFRM